MNLLFSIDHNCVDFMLNCIYSAEENGGAEGEECCRDRLSRNPQHEDYPYRNQIGHSGRHEESLAIHEREKAHRSIPLFLREFWSI